MPFCSLSSNPISSPLLRQQTARRLLLRLLRWLRLLRLLRLLLPGCPFAHLREDFEQELLENLDRRLNVLVGRIPSARLPHEMRQVEQQHDRSRRNRFRRNPLRGALIHKFHDAGDFDGVCDVWNRGRKTAAIGDSNGYDDRASAWSRAQKVLV